MPRGPSVCPGLSSGRGAGDPVHRGDRVARGLGDLRFADAAHARRRGMVVQPPRARLAERLVPRLRRGAGDPVPGGPLRPAGHRPLGPGRAATARPGRGDCGPRRRRASGDGRHLGTQRGRRPAPGVSSGSCVAVRYAATHPERVRRLALYGSYADGHRLAPEAARRSLTSVVAAHWGLGSRVLADLFLPGAGPDERDAFARFQRLSASAEAAAASLASVYAMDVRGDLPEVTTPTLVRPSPGRPHHSCGARPRGRGRRPGRHVRLARRGRPPALARPRRLGDAGRLRVPRRRCGSRTGTPSAGRSGVIVRARGGGPASRRSRTLRRRDRGSPVPQPAHRASPRREHPHEARSHLPGGRSGGRGPRRSRLTVARVGHPPGWPVLAMRG